MGSINLLEARRNVLMSQPHLTTEFTNPLTFQTDISVNLMDCKIYFEPVQEGSGDPSPNNVRPITGWDVVTVYKTGKNLCPNVLETRTLKGVTATVNNDGSVTVNGTATGYGELNILEEFILPERITYAFKGGADGGSSSTYRLYFEFYNYETNAWNGKALTSSSRIETFTSDKIRRVKIQFYSGVTVDNITFYPMVCKSTETDLTYEPFGSILTIPFPQTIYGGYVDLVKGEVVEEWSQIASYNGETLPGEWISDRDVYTAGTSPTIGAQVAYKLATPITYQLTPETVKTLKGVNNIWSNANGNIEVKFWKH